MERIFDNTEVSFALKSNSELSRALLLFELIKKKPLVRIGSTLTVFAIKYGLPVERIIRATVFDHFCGGVNEEDCLKIVRKLYSENVYTVLDYSSEGKQEDNQFQNAVEKTLKTLEYAKENTAIPFVVFKPTGFGRSDIYQKLTEIGNLNESDQQEWIKIKNRFDLVCGKAHDCGVRVLIDAEESWMQDAADELVEEMMEKYNKKEVIVFNTVQAYRWDRLDYVKSLIQKAGIKGFKIGIKLVRGAYMEKERERSKLKGYKDPICIDKKATNDSFNSILNFLLAHINSVELFAGTHNEESSYLLMEIMKKNGLPKNDQRIWFGQLYGMSDHISFNLSAKGFNTAKYLPYGPVKDVMPYLLRRAEENTSVADQTYRELFLIKKEIKRRKLINSMR